ncbi:phosphatase PAP2 family protein [Natrialba swarupiae]|uniref:Inositol phosphorylceramide synthase n=1 Tax=Natrialba swarupiae TaxID=2448032 RepID=A0A5D5AIF9_9EURY|nr:phosphatase PAP2 family protein [Natrialba swarupiae]TYT60924.1 inositol phosphorylceramide synthase [Natrialba swarupiae]
MSLLGVVIELAFVVVAMLATATLVFVGPRRLSAAIRDFRWRFRVCLLSVVALVTVLAIRWSTVDVVMRLERRVLGTNITPILFEIEQAVFPENPVIVLQSFQSPELTSFFVFVYIYGYAFLLLFPFIAYFALEDAEELRTLILAFTANYAIGLVCYVFFIAYGPRNFDPLLFEGLLYDAFPQSRMLTNQVNQSTNVFPSLHTSLSMTVFFLAVLTRRKYPVWVPISGVLAISVVVSTMYLGIHWFSDVVAGTILAVVSVYVGRNYTVQEIAGSVRQYLGTGFNRTGRADGD